VSGPAPVEALEVLEVLEPGLLTTIQDGGRFCHEAEGVPRSGAADAIGLAVANLALGNRHDAAAIECTLLGPRLRLLADVAIGIGGADLGARIESSGVALEPGASYLLRTGDVIEFEAPSDGDGCRAYLALPGGIDVARVLGSRSTCLPAGFGGHEGRALRAGDRLAAVGRTTPRSPEPPRGGDTSARRQLTRLPADLASALPSPAQRLRILPGPASGVGDPAWRGLIERSWTVDPASDRRGLRLVPANAAADVHASRTDEPLVSLAAGELPSHGVLPGAVQVTPSGQPLVLMPDSGTTGGYPVVAVVIHADLSLLGQLAPGAEVRFRETTHEAARAAELDRRALVEGIRLRMADASSR
jgi:biotin-dependent carboxylase-like uncharacterized protein